MSYIVIRKIYNVYYFIYKYNLELYVRVEER